MSEKSSHGGEHHSHQPSHEQHESKPVHHETHETEPIDQPDSIEAIQQKIEQHAKKAETVSVDSNEVSSGHAPYIDKGQKETTYRRSLAHIRTRLSKRERVLSNIVHQKTVERVSEITGKTLARPSGILGGGLCALLGSSILVYLSRTYGFSYNAFVTVLCFVGGFVVGMVLELLLYSLHKRR